ncbi:MAG: glucose-1-phosphate cytidylyltransferase [Euryarchaeota archaeon]|nr:glucose-1-phosphate cytidylyltransferase [Euryarchaeota archaeon]
MPVVILCGGFGSRLGSETEGRPKPMIPIGNRPMLWHIMKIYARWGFRNFVLALGYKSEVVKDYFMFFREYNGSVEVDLRTGSRKCLGGPDEVDWNVRLIDTGENTLKGGRIKRVEPHIRGDRFMLTYGDGVADIDIPELVRFHRSHKRIGTVTGVNPPSRFGELVVKGNRVLLFTEKPQTSQGLINGGFFVFERAIFDHLAADEGCDFEKGPLEELAGKDQLRVYKHPGVWECMDTVRDMNHLNRLWAEGKAFWKIW